MVEEEVVFAYPSSRRVVYGEEVNCIGKVCKKGECVEMNGL